MSPHAALAATIGFTTQELSEYRYQSTRTPHSVYFIADEAYCARSKPPTALCGDGMVWTPMKDQFFAKQAHTIVWVGTYPATT